MGWLRLVGSLKSLDIDKCKSLLSRFFVAVCQRDVDVFQKYVRAREKRFTLMNGIYTYQYPPFISVNLFSLALFVSWQIHIGVTVNF